MSFAAFLTSVRVPNESSLKWKTALALLPAIALPIAWAALGPRWANVLADALKSLGPFGELVFVLAGACFVALCAPSGLLYMTGGMLYGVTRGTLWGGLAATLGSIMAFMIARTALGHHAAELMSKHSRLDRFERALNARGLWLVFWLRLSLIFPIAPVSYALGLSRIPTRHFFWSLPALLPTVFVYCYAGALAHVVFDTGPRQRAGWEWALLGLGLVATLIAAWLVGRAAGRALQNEARASRRIQQRERVTHPNSVDRSGLEPPLPFDEHGKERTVGVEVEFAALDLAAAGGAIQRLLGGEIVREHEFRLRVRGTSLGDFRVEVDSHALQDLAKRRRRSAPLRLFERLKGALLSAVADTITPHEVTSAPLRFEQLHDIDRLVHALGRAGAEGTDDSIFHVCGVHLNPSVPSSDPLELRDYIRAYVLLHAELVEELHVDPKRRVMRFATAYPMAYARKVLDPNYAPDLSGLIDDYLQYNATRNRGLDLLPLFLHLDPTRVRGRVDDPRVQGRPTFHFRLPNSEIGNPLWRVTDEWRLWLEVEELAYDKARIAAISRDARERFELPPALRGRWHALRRRAGAQR
jgi:uncharacterized membrane protein YdjX (TVP38/TMEM64 family)